MWKGNTCRCSMSFLVGALKIVLCKIWREKFGTFKELMFDRNSLVEAKFLLNVFSDFMQALIQLGFDNLKLAGDRGWSRYAHWWSFFVSIFRDEWDFLFHGNDFVERVRV